MYIYIYIDHTYHIYICYISRNKIKMHKTVETEKQSSAIK